MIPRCGIRIRHRAAYFHVSPRVSGRGRLHSRDPTTSARQYVRGTCARRIWPRKQKESKEKEGGDGAWVNGESYAAPAFAEKKGKKNAL